MADITISELAAAGTLDGSELVEVSQVSTTVTITASTISAQASDNSFNDSANGFIAAGFAVNDRVRVTGFTGDTANNILVGKVTDVTAGKLTIGGTDGDVIVDDAAGESVTISKWVSRRATMSNIAGGWEIAGTWTYSTAVANVDFTGLAGYKDLIVVGQGVSFSVSGALSLRLSTNNGSSFFAGASDYSIFDQNGSTATGSLIGLWSTNTTAARTAAAQLLGANVSGNNKVVTRFNRAGDGLVLFTGSTAPVNAIRLLGSGGGNFTAGTIRVLGRR